MLVRFKHGVLRVPEGTEAPGGAGDPAAIPVHSAAPPPGLPPAADGARTHTFKQMLDSVSKPPAQQTQQPGSPETPAAPAAPTPAPPVQVKQPAQPAGQDKPADQQPGGETPTADGDKPDTPAVESKAKPNALDIKLDDDFDFDDPENKPASESADGEVAASREEEDEIWKSIKDIPLDDINSDPEIADRVRGALFKTGRGRRMLAYHKQMSDLSKPYNDGGIGFTPSNDQIRQMYERSAAYEDFAADLEEAHSDPAKAERLLNFMLRDAEGPRQAATTFAQRFPAVLAKTAPEAFQGLQASILNNYLRILEVEADRATSQADRDYALKLRDALAYKLGTSLPPRNGDSRMPAPGKHRDQDPEVERLMRENAQMREQLSGAERANFDNYLDSFLGDGRQVVSNMLDVALPGVRDLLGGDTIADPYLRDRVDDVLDRVAQDRLFMQSIERRVQRAYQSRDQQARDQALADFKRHVRSHVLPVARSIQEALRSRSKTNQPVDVQRNAALHQSMQARQDNAPAEGQGAPVHAAAAPSVEWNPKLGATANFKNILNAIPR